MTYNINNSEKIKQFPLIIEKLDKNELILNVSGNETVSAILQQLQTDFGIPPNQSLVFKFRELLPQRTLKSYLIGSEIRGNKLRLCAFDKRDQLKNIELKIQKWWEDNETFKVDAPEKETTREKFLATFPFPYVNGLVHCGHGFSLSKAEFACGYQRLKGKKTLFPFGFHCTGMPIVACANKLGKEIKQFGNPPKFPVIEPKNDQNDTKTAQNIKKKGKLAAKTSKKLHQYEIMQEIGIPEEEIPEFQDPLKWVHYFTPKCFEHLKRFGAKIDARRSFVTTELNPFFSRFIEWQFNSLKRKEFLRFGKRMCVFAPEDNQPCADHDRASGEGVQPQEYTAIKMQIVPCGTSDRFSWLQKFPSRSVFLVAATLRPETMYGQTNCFVKPNGDYILVEAKNNDLYVCSESSAKNMSFQGVTQRRGEFEVLERIKGWNLLGLKVAAPNSIHGEVFVLPLLTISMAKGTAVVTSVPSDSPDDYINYIELQNNKEYREKYHVDSEMVKFGIEPIISVPEFGEIAAKTAVEKFKVRSPNDEKRLKEAKAEVYLKGFYKGTLLVGPYKNQFVEKAKEKVKNDLLEAKLAFKYFEPAERVVSRSGQECVVAETNQWFIHYGEEPLKSRIKEHIRNGMDFYSDSTRDRFLETVDWMKQWACSRKFGLGTKLPFDKDWLIESLSDSTIYMAYYTISHYLPQGGLEVCASDKRIDLQPEDLSDEIFDAIFLGKELPETGSGSPLQASKLRAMKKEFEFWYPLDLRVSGKDLINNHLVMSLYNHAFIWEDRPDLWPQSMYANGLATINAEKMSKSTGNYFTLIECIEQYGADATRLAFADAGDSLDDANFAPDTCNSAIMRLNKELNWVKSAIKRMRSENDEDIEIEIENRKEKTFADLVFLNEINQAVNEADKFYSTMKFRAALNSGFYALCNSRSTYSTLCKDTALDRECVETYVKYVVLVAAPICSHWSEHLWAFQNNADSFFTSKRWPDGKLAIDQIILRKSEYLKDVGHKLRLSIREHNRKNVKKRTGSDLLCYIFITDNFSPLRIKVIETMKSVYDATAGDVNKEQVSRAVMRTFQEDKKNMKQAMMFSAFLMKEMKEKGGEVLELKMPFDQKELLTSQSKYLFRDIEAKEIKVIHLDEISRFSEGTKKLLKRNKIAEKVSPGKVGIYCTTEELK